MEVPVTHKRIYYANKFSVTIRGESTGGAGGALAPPTAADSLEPPWGTGKNFHHCCWVGGAEKSSSSVSLEVEDDALVSFLTNRHSGQGSNGPVSPHLTSIAAQEGPDVQGPAPRISFAAS